MTEFDAKAARTKYSCPIWIDAFLRKTMQLSTAEIGAYHLLLYAMWTRRSCDLPDDDAKLARICRMSRTMWRRNYRPVMETYFEIKNGMWVSKRLRQEARKVEDFLVSQSRRKRGGVENASEKREVFAQKFAQENRGKLSQEIDEQPIENKQTDRIRGSSGEVPGIIQPKIPSILVVMVVRARARPTTVTISGMKSSTPAAWTTPA